MVETRAAAAILTLPDGTEIRVQATERVKALSYERGEERVEARFGPITFDQAKVTTDNGHS
jgi:hypothetical protein